MSEELLVVDFIYVRGSDAFEGFRKDSQIFERKPRFYLCLLGVHIIRVLI
jgi:hypothetical protein